MKVGVALLAFTAIVTLALGAAADSTKRQCAASAETGQRLRDEGRPLAARTQLLACLRYVCPAVVRASCSRWLDEVDASIPTVVIKARAGSVGHAIDVTDVGVAVDGAPTLAALDGQPLRLEPGAHLLRYTHPGTAPIEVRILLVAGEKNRPLIVEFSTNGPISQPSPSPSPPTPMPLREVEPPHGEGAARPLALPSSAAASTSVHPMAWAFAGLALAAGGSFAYFGATGKSELDSLRSTCAGHCESGPVSSAWDKLIAADASLAIGVVSAGVATWLFLSPRREVSAPKEGASSGLQVEPGPHGLRLGWTGAF